MLLVVLRWVVSGVFKVGSGGRPCGVVISGGGVSRGVGAAGVIYSQCCL